MLCIQQSRRLERPLEVADREKGRDYEEEPLRFVCLVFGLIFFCKIAFSLKFIKTENLFHFHQSFT